MENDGTVSLKPGFVKQLMQRWDRFKMPFWLDITVNIVVVIVLLIAIRTFIFLPFNVDGQSMEPTLHHKEFIYVDKLLPVFSGYDYGDVVVLYPPTQNGKVKTVQEKGLMCVVDNIKNIVLFQGKENPCLVKASFVKRIIGLPGDRVEIKNGNVYVTPKDSSDRIMVREDFLLDENKGRTCVPASACSRMFQLKSEAGKDYGVIQDGHYFVLGDNRTNSSDSRAEGWDTPFISEENITGIVRAVYLSPKQVPQQSSVLLTYFEAFKALPYAFLGVRFIGDADVLESGE